MALKLSNPVIKGLQQLDTEINSDISKRLIANTLKHTLSPEASVHSVPDIYVTNADKAKLSEYAVTLFSVATKHGTEAGVLRSILEKCEIQSSAQFRFLWRRDLKVPLDRGGLPD